MPAAAGEGNGFELGTARLRPFDEADLAAFVAYRREPQVARYQDWDEDFSLDDALPGSRRLAKWRPARPARGSASRSWRGEG